MAYLDDKTKARMLKVAALATGGVDGEKETAERQLAKMLDAFGIEDVNSLSESRELFWFYFRDKIEKKILRQCIGKVCGNGITTWRRRMSKDKIGVEVTPLQKAEISMMRDVYSRAYKKEVELFYYAFLYKNDLLLEASESGETLSDAEAFKLHMMANGIDTVTINKMLENDNG